jgi:GTP-binding protein
MQVHTAEFVVGAVRPADFPLDGLPEVAFAGRSNVGKSSLINRLVQRKKLARTSSTPGKTQQLNYYRINNALYMVDLPGYGFVHGGVDLRRKLSRMTMGYLERRDQLKAIVQLVDARHGPTPLDLEMLAWLRGHARPFLLVFTKADKLSRTKLSRQFKDLEALDELAGAFFAPFSAISGLGREDIWGWIRPALGLEKPRPEA